MTSPEAAAVSLNSYLLSEAVSSIASVAWFAQKLTETSLITRNVSNDIVLTVGLSNTDKCYRLLSAVEAQVAANPSLFHTLVDILRSKAALICYADVITKSYEVESKKRTSTITLHSLPTHSSPMIFKFMQEFSVMVPDIVQILQHHKGALEKMTTAFEQRVIPMKCAAYTALVSSQEYHSINSVQALFKLLAPYWKPVHCPLLIELVNATECKAAIERLQVYLTSRQEAGESIILGEEDEDICEPIPDITVENASITTHGCQGSPTSGHSYPNESTTMGTSTYNAPKHSSLYGAESASPQYPSCPSQTPESYAILSQPTVNTDSLQISAKVAQDRVTWAEYDRKTTLICRVLKIPTFMLQFCEVESGPVVIHWITSGGLLSYIMSNLLGDGDLELLLQENILSIQVGLEYIIVVGSPAYWKKDLSGMNRSKELVTDLSDSNDLSDSSDLSVTSGESMHIYDMDEPDLDLLAIQKEIDEEYALKLQEHFYTDDVSPADEEYALKLQEHIYTQNDSPALSVYSETIPPALEHGCQHAKKSLDAKKSVANMIIATSRSRCAYLME